MNVTSCVDLQSAALTAAYAQAYGGPVPTVAAPVAPAASPPATMPAAPRQWPTRALLIGAVALALLLYMRRRRRRRG